VILIFVILAYPCVCLCMFVYVFDCDDYVCYIGVDEEPSMDT